MPKSDTILFTQYSIEGDVCEVFVFKYRLLYEVGENRVTVVAFLHGARDFATWRQNQKDL